MDKQRMQLLMPVRTRRSNLTPRRPESKTFILSDMITVSALADKTPKKQINQIPPYNKVKNGKKYENIKQERYQRLNRDSKLKLNDEWADILQRKSDLQRETETDQLNNTSTNLTQIETLQPNYYKTINEANKQIDEAAMQLEEISKFIEAKKNKTVKHVKSPKKQAKNYVKLNKNHVCTKGIYQDKVNSIDSMMNYFDKHMKIDEDSMDSKRHYASAKELKQRKKKIESTLGQVNERLTKVKKKYFDSDYNTNKIDPIMNRTKYHSIKEMSDRNTNFETTMEAWQRIKDVQQNDLDSTPYISQTKNMTQLYKNAECTQTSYDDLSDKDDKDEESFDYHQMLNDKQLLSADVSQIIQKYRPNASTIETKSIGLDATPKKNALKDSILKSDYLRKEFDNNCIMAGHFDFGGDDSINKPNKPKDWSKELAFFMK